MARPKSPTTMLSQLPIDKQIMAQGIQAIIMDRAAQPPAKDGPAHYVLAQEFLNWLANDRVDVLNRAITEFAVQRVSA